MQRIFVGGEGWEKRPRDGVGGPGEADHGPQFQAHTYIQFSHTLAHPGVISLGNGTLTVLFLCLSGISKELSK